MTQQIASKSEIKKRLESNIKRRQSAEKRFRALGMSAVLMGIMFILVLFTSIIGNGYKAFYTHNITIDIDFAAEGLDPTDLDALNKFNYAGLVKDTLKDMFPEVKKRKEKKKLYELITSGAGFELKDRVLENPSIVNQTISLTAPVGDDIDMYLKGYFNEDSARISKGQVEWVQTLQDSGQIKKGFNINFFKMGDSREPELAGVRGAIMGSLFTLLVTFCLSFPIGVAAACYLEEFAPKNKWTDIVEVNINNLAAVPSIVFGLLGLAVFINFFGFPRSTALVGGFVLTLMTLPTIIISSRAALKSVPPSIRNAALGMGASKLQTLFHHTLPLAMPGMLTGSIIGMAQALGETAPLLMIGMIAFIVDVPSSPLDPSTVLPVQIYLWADSPERAFVEKTSAAIMVLLGFLISMNAFAVYLRKKFERKW